VKKPARLTTKAILGQVSGEDVHKAYRMKTQHYSEEQSSVWEDVKHGLIYGSQEFVADLKSRFLSDQKDKELFP
jgi:putative transposase